MLRQYIKSLFLTCSIILITTIGFAQCGISTNQGTITPTVATQNTATITTGKPYWEFAATAGCEYTFTTCGNTFLDSYLRLYDNTWALLALNDDDCGTRSTITWTAPSTATYRILLTTFVCNNLSGSGASITYSTDCGAATCSDGIQNQGETGIDCGGPCPPCAVSCNDGIQNQGETGIDCGGPCPACPTCNDGIQNQGETGIDCGGPCPAVCPVNCAELGFDDVASTFTGTHSMWTTMRGRNNVAGPYTIEGPIANEPIISSQFNEFHDLRPGNDPSAGFCYFPDGTIPVPNGSQNVMRLGAYQQIGMDASGMTTTFVVTEPYLVYSYILGFESTGHTINNRGFCTFEVRDNGGVVLPCGSFQVYENGPTENWTFHTAVNDVWLMDAWKTVTMDVTDYVGQALTIEVWVADCQEGAHSGFGYFDFECLSVATPDCSVTPLPVELVHFTGECEDNTPVLQWKTVSERNNDYFTVWHSTDGIHFDDIGRVNGAGNSTQETNYRFELPSMLSEMNYFYLSQTDYDGASEEFDAISFEECLKNETVIYMDRGQNIHVLDPDLEKIQLISTAGQVVKQWDQLESPAILNVSNVSRGIYFLQIENEKQSVYKIYIGETE